MRQIQPIETISYPPWLPNLQKALSESRLAPLSQRSYEQSVKLFLRWLDHVGQPFEKLNEGDVAAYRQHLVNHDQLKATTINQRLHAIRWLCRWALKKELLQSNPAAEVGALRIERKRRPATLKEDELYALLRVAGQSRPTLRHRNFAIVHLMIQAGLRVGEVVALSVGDVTLYDRRGHVRVRLGKGRKERVVPLNASVRRALRLYIERRDASSDRDALFMSQEGRRLSRRSVQHLLRELGSRAKIDRLRVTPHTLRHTFATNFLRDNPGKLVELQTLLGHESLDTTSIYTRPSQEDLAAQLERSRHNVYG